MPRLLGRKLECFYCGCRSAQNYTQGLREWQCKKCDAVNYLDKNGEVTDPPATETSSQIRYAQAIPRPASPETSSAEDSLFCQTCLKNQHLLTQSLAEYYPSSDHPDYAKYEREYPRYRKNLEDRYPQICEQCEPRVRAKIQKTGYAAKTDHLRRMMEQTRGLAGSRQAWGWKSVAVAVGETVWYLSLLGQFSWHLMNTLKLSEDQDGLRDAVVSPLLPSCLWQDLQNASIEPACAEAYSSVPGFALCLGLLSIWWNPRLEQKFKPRRGRITGMSEYYKLQVIFLTVRSAAWAVLAQTPSFDFDAQTIKGIHAFMLVFTILSIIVSYRTIQVDYTPLVKFQDSPKPLISQRPQQVPVNRTPQPSYSQRTQSYVHNGPGTSRTQPFPINSLAPTPPQPYPPSGAPLTPPLDEDDSEAMDWTPSQGSLRPATSYRSSQPKPIPVQPSPFYGKLPPNPTSQNHRLRNAPNQPALLEPSIPQSQNLFTRMFPPKKEDEFSDIGSEPSPLKQATFSPQFAPPRFFPPSNQRDETGLESIFSSTFAIADEPDEVRVARQQEHIRQRQGITSTSTQCTLTILLLFALLAWYTGLRLVRYVLLIPLASLGLAAVVAGRNLFQAMRKDRAFWCLSDLLVFGCELGLAIFLASVVKSPSSAPFADGSSGLGNLGLGLLFAMTCQEIWIAVNESLKSPQEPAPAPTPALSSPTKSNNPPSPTSNHQQPSPTFINASFSIQASTNHHPSPAPTNPSFSSSFSSHTPSSSLSYPSLTRAPTDYYPSFSTTASSHSQHPTSAATPSRLSSTSSYISSPTPTRATLAPSDSYSAYGGTPRMSNFPRSGGGGSSGGRGDSDLSGLGGLSLGSGGGFGEGRRRRGPRF